jgi:uncharacterized protein YjbI with pentapeptide repeats
MFDPNLVRDCSLKEKAITGAMLKAEYPLNLSRFDLSNSEFSPSLPGSVFFSSNFEESNLEGVDFSHTYLQAANFRHSNLKNARFFNANLTAAEFEGAILPEFQIPQKVELIVWKKLSGATSQHYDTRIAKLLIPADAMRTASLIGKKCRAERAVVLEIVDLSTGTEVLRASSLRNANFIYRVGESIVPDGHTYNHDFRHECKPGIHFFMTRGEAISYFM